MINITHQVASSPLQTFRSELQATVIAVAQLESTVKEAQERLRKAADKANYLRGLIAIYESEEGTDRGPALPAPVGDNPDHAPAPTLGNAGDSVASAEVMTKKDRMTQSIAALLRSRGSVHRTDILAHLVAQTIMGGEKNGMAHLAAYLSDNRNKFTSDGRGNFSLRQLTLDDAAAHLRPRPNGSSQEETGGVAPPADSIA